VIPSLLEIALRALLVAAAVWVGLRAMGVREVLAQKAAWGLVLVAAILMPLLLPLAMRSRLVPAAMTLSLPQLPGRLKADASPAPESARPSAQRDSAGGTAPYAELVESRSVTAAPRDSSTVSDPVSSGLVSSGARSTIQTPPPLARSEDAPAAGSVVPSLKVLGWSFYLAVCAVLLLRIVYGLTSAASLWLDAEPIVVDHAVGMRLRVSRAVSSPVTIGSGVVLPADYDEWDAEKLRIVLAHERSHIRQGDFYLQLLAGVYSALFWFSPLGWWLKRTLSDLGEAISDRAGLEEAANRSTYAQILLEFAGLPRPTLIGVAMARTSSLSHRIERLLNESSFRQAFSVSRGRALAAVLMVPIALFAATALVRVQAAGQPSPVIATHQAAAPVTGVSNPDQAIDPVAPVAQAPAAPPPPANPAVPTAPAGPGVTAVPPGAAAAPEPPEPPDADDDNVTIGAGQTLTITNTNTNSGHSHSYSRSGVGPGFAFLFQSGDEDSYALVTGPAGSVRFSGDWADGRRQQIDQASRVAHGKFLWFSRDGKSYVIDDPGIIANIEAMYKPMDELGRKQEELGRQQEALGKQQEELGHKQEQASVPAPDVSKEIAELNAALAKLQAKTGSNLTQDDLGDIQSKIGDLQGKLGDIEGKIGEEQGRLGEAQGRLGEQQGKLGEEQGRLGEEQGRIAREADRKVRAIIVESLQNGKARPVE
jgi:beta-lactamase regulating signal transducer with metallopeptidase domain